MHELLFHRQKALEDGDLRGYAAQLGRTSGLRSRPGQQDLRERIQRDVDSGLALGQVLGTPTLFIDDVVHRGGYVPAHPAGGAGHFRVIRSRGAR